MRVFISIAFLAFFSIVNVYGCEGFTECEKQAKQGDAVAQYNLGVRYAIGEGVIQDYLMAHMFWNIASANGNSGAKQNRDKIAKQMTSEQIAIAQKMAREWIASH